MDVKNLPILRQIGKLQQKLGYMETFLMPYSLPAASQPGKPLSSKLRACVMTMILFYRTDTDMYSGSPNITYAEC